MVERVLGLSVGSLVGRVVSWSLDAGPGDHKASVSPLWVGLCLGAAA